MQQCLFDQNRCQIRFVMRKNNEILSIKNFVKLPCHKIYFINQNPPISLVICQYKLILNLDFVLKYIFPKENHDKPARKIATFEIANKKVAS